MYYCYFSFFSVIYIRETRKYVYLVYIGNIKLNNALNKNNVITISVVKELNDMGDDITSNFAPMQHLDTLSHDLRRNLTVLFHDSTPPFHTRFWVSFKRMTYNYVIVYHIKHENEINLL